MAYPTVNAYSSGKVTTPTWGHTFTIPNGTAADDLLILFIVSSIASITYWTVPANTSINWEGMSYGYNQNLSLSTHVVYARALGNGNDMIQVQGKSTGTGENVDSCIAYICYRIAGVSWPQYNIYSPNNNMFSLTSGSIANWVIDESPEDIDSVSDTHLWLVMVGSLTNKIAISPPSNFTNLITEVGSGVGTVSMSSCRREATQATLTPGAFVNAPLSDYIGITIRIKPGSYPYPITNGFGIMYPFRKVYKTP